MAVLTQAVMDSSRLEKVQSRTASLFVGSAIYNNYPLAIDYFFLNSLIDRAWINGWETHRGKFPLLEENFR